VTYLLDTNVLSELRKPAPADHVIAWFDATPPEALYLSVIAIGELRHGAERVRRRDPDRSGELEAWIAGVRTECADRILPVTVPIAEAWGRLRARATLPVVDTFLVATALIHGLVVVSRDHSTAERVGVPWLDPWSA
jgi:predicted nucleic acid-binding protein